MLLSRQVVCFTKATLCMCFYSPCLFPGRQGEGCCQCCRCMQQIVLHPVSDTSQTDSGPWEKRNEIKSKKRLHIFAMVGGGVSRVLRISKKYAGGSRTPKRMRSICLEPQLYIFFAEISSSPGILQMRQSWPVVTI